MLGSLHSPKNCYLGLSVAEPFLTAFSDYNNIQVAGADLDRVDRVPEPCQCIQIYQITEFDI